MEEYPNWQQLVVPQKNPAGCIPWCYEMMLRAITAEGIQFESFQDEFDLNNIQKAPVANFMNVAQAVESKYSGVKFRVREFAESDGPQKLAFIEKCFHAGRLVALSLALHRLMNYPNWHTMVVIGLDANDIMLLHSVRAAGPLRWTLSRTMVEEVHRVDPGGKDVACLLTY